MKNHTATNTEMKKRNDDIVVMKRYELKYVLTKEQTEYVVEKLRGHLEVDKYGKTSIASLYYDTPDYLLARRSLEKPCFKEKIRLRSYGIATDASPVFLELKRKYDGIVYKRRIASTLPAVDAFFRREEGACADGQIAKEVSYFRDYYKNLAPACLIIYDRVAYFQPEGDIRLTIDYNPRYRFHDLNLTTSMDGTSILSPGCTVMEIKVQEAMPLWLTHILDEGQIRKSSLSKYGEAYKALQNAVFYEKIS